MECTRGSWRNDEEQAGAEVSVGVSDKYSIVNYFDDMNVMIRSMERDRMRLMVNSENHSGKFLMMNIDNSSLTWNERQKVRLYLDNKPMRQVMSEQELYEANESSFWLNLMGRNRMQAVMYIANFSERQVDIVVEDEGTPAATLEATKQQQQRPKHRDLVSGWDCCVLPQYIGYDADHNGFFGD